MFLLLLQQHLLRFENRLERQKRQQHLWSLNLGRYVQLLRGLHLATIEIEMLLCTRQANRQFVLLLLLSQRHTVLVLQQVLLHRLRRLQQHRCKFFRSTLVNAQQIR